MVCKETCGTMPRRFGEEGEEEESTSAALKVFYSTEMKQLAARSTSRCAAARAGVETAEDKQDSCQQHSS